MTAYDTVTSMLAERLRLLPKRALITVFWACATALLPEAELYAAHRGDRSIPDLKVALEAAHELATLGKHPSDASELLRKLEMATPGPSPDRVDSGNAQDCWICTDICIRVFVDPDYDACPAIWYAIEPILSQATQELFGCSQIGSSDQEEAQIQAIINHPRVASAVEFCRWACDFLHERERLSEADLAIVKERASVLAP